MMPFPLYNRRIISEIFGPFFYLIHLLHSKIDRFIGQHCMRLSLKNLSITIPILLGGIALFLHGYLGYFSRYIADDFCSAYQAGRLGILRAAWFWYLTWSGRFSASILDSIVGLLGPRAVPFLVPITIVFGSRF